MNPGSGNFGSRNFILSSQKESRVVEAVDWTLSSLAENRFELIFGVEEEFYCLYVPRIWVFRSL